ncbi:hypothetical protein [Curtobacterium sp. MCBA15_001]|uniref:hypothetical protein n=1 Tax=Curtobacterium sp. MCBA15_001 TaxID=1898731 RepID=UPI0008DE9581|nr:hypothetical protein [Curtobacterium sp. MCBA15_001]OIH94073.1 hypothetical protein BIU90_06000 [Curtobacterium sp. MCBA15_001]
MDHQDDTVSGHVAQHCDRSCDSTFDRWRCTMPVGHEGPHRAGDASGRTEWNDRAAGRRLRDLARPAAHAERDARAADRT